MKGIIFDFNGTMFQDSPLHEEAWLEIIEKYGRGDFDPAEAITKLHGKTNAQIIKTFISPDLSDDKITEIADEKEADYRKLCLANPAELKLTDGLEDALNELKAKKVPLTIASAAPKSNIDFYFDVFDLGRWFDPTLVVYDDGSFPGKPAPDIFLLAAKKLGLPPEECVVIEDSYSGLQAANRANIGIVIAIDPDYNHRQLYVDEKLVSPEFVIKDFSGFVELVGY